MKATIQSLLLICVLLCFCHCGHKPYPQSLMMADSLASACPDSAVSLLKSIAGTMQDEPEATRMYYRLLCIKANDKAYIEHTSDSLILPVLHYYLEKDDERHLPEAYYYAGRVYRDLGDAPQALEYFEKALEALPEEGKYPLKGKIYSQMGMLFLYQGLYNEALDVFKKRHICNVELKDSVGMVYTLRDMADAYRNINKEDSSIYYYREAYNMFACNGILFNHESPRRGENFVTRKITLAIANILAGKQEKLSLGNMNAKRDWGFAGDYVEGMWRMLQQDKPGDYVLATNETHTVREFVEKAFGEVGIRIRWEGEGVNEKGYDDKTGRLLVDVNPEFYRPSEVEFLWGNCEKAERELGWHRKTDFAGLVAMMMEADMQAICGMSCAEYKSREQ